MAINKIRLISQVLFLFLLLSIVCFLMVETGNIVCHYGFRSAWMPVNSIVNLTLIGTMSILIVLLMIKESRDVITLLIRRIK